MECKSGDEFWCYCLVLHYLALLILWSKSFDEIIEYSKTASLKKTKNWFSRQIIA